MYTGDFFDQFFSERGDYDIKDNGEVNVCCPFPHDKGYDTHPSAHVSTRKNLFHCKTCFAEGRSPTGGYSEIGFMSKVRSISYTEALQMFQQLSTADGVNEEQWGRAVEALQSTKYIAYLEKRGISAHTAKEYKLAYLGSGIAYPITIHGTICDVRTYSPNETPKIKSRVGASPLLFPFDHWRLDDRPTIMAAGENDCLITRQHGFNALTVTAGEGSFPKMFLSYFQNRTIYIAYDCDLAGKRSSRRVAHILKEAGATVYLLDLGLSGEKDDKDLTDYFVKHGKTSLDLDELIANAQEYNGDLFLEDRNIVYPLVNLWDIANGAYENKRLSTRVIMTGKFDMDMRIPYSAEWKCKQLPEPKGEDADEAPNVCQKCPLRTKHGWWSAEDENLKDIMYLVERNENDVRNALLHTCIGAPKGCPMLTYEVRERMKVHKVVFAPDVETEHETSGFQAAEQYAYVIGDSTLQDGSRYRSYFRPCAHPLQGQRVYMLVDRVEDSDNALNTFKMTPQIQQQLEVFRNTDVNAAMRDRAKRMKKIIDTPYMNPDPMITYGIDLVYHSPLSFKFLESRIKKGYPEIAIIGESRTGKTEALESFQRYVGIGNMTVLKEASRASILGGSEKLPNGTSKVKWGTVPRNHRGLLGLDEMSGMPQEVIAALTDMRSSGVATLEKMGGGKAPAKTRLVWLSNPRPKQGRERKLSSYAYGTDVVRELVGTDEDMARFDAIMLIAQDKTGINSWMEHEDCTPYDREAYRNLIYWCWSRTEEQVVWANGVENYIKHTADELNELYDSHIKLFGYEAWKKIARMSISCAGATFSCTEDGEGIYVTKDHVDWVKNFLLACYINPVFKLHKFVESHRVYEETNSSVDLVVTKLVKSNRLLMKTLIDAPDGECSFRQLELLSNLDRKEFQEVMNQLATNYLIKTTSNGVMPTQRLHKSINNYRLNYEKSELIPLSRQGGSGI